MVKEEGAVLEEEEATHEEQAILTIVGHKYEDTLGVAGTGISQAAAVPHQTEQGTQYLTCWLFSI